jgi:hypothetical protein
MLTFAFLMDFSQSALFLDLPFQFLFLHLLITVCTQFHHLFLGRQLKATSLRIIFQYMPYFSVTIPSINLTNSIQLTFFLTNGILHKSPNRGISSLFYHFLPFSFILIPHNILLKAFVSKAASHLAIPLFHVKDSALYVATGLVMVIQNFTVSAMSTD